MINNDMDDYRTISEIQNFAFCRRQWALKHLEQQWGDNVFTVDGEILHENVHDESFNEKRGDVIITRGMRVFSHKLRVTGVCDVVEFHLTPGGIPLFGRAGLFQPCPVEYKRGKPKAHDADILQLTAQTICLEEMLLCDIKTGFIYYNQPHRRLRVDFTAEHRQRVADILTEIHTLVKRKHTPKVKTNASCRSCSLRDVCLPRLSRSENVTEYIARHIAEDV